MFLFPKHLRFALRMLGRQPWTAAAIVLSIAVGVGANTAVTGVLEAVLLNPLGVPHPDRIASITVHLRKLQTENAQASAAELQDLQSLRETFSDVTATELRTWTVGDSEPSRFSGVAVTPEFFRIFAQPLALGRSLQRTDRFAVVISDALWHRAFGADPLVLERTMLLDGQAYRVVGVARPTFRFPVTAQAWVPLT